MYETDYTKVIKSLQINTDDDFYVFKDNRFKQSEERVQDILNEELDQGYDDEEVMYNTVKVQLMDIQWLRRQGRNFLNLVRVLTVYDAKNQQLLQTKFVSSLLEAFWETYKQRILWEQFIPFCCYLFVIVNFMALTLHDGFEGTTTYYCVYFPLVGAIVVFISNQIAVELFQLRHRKYSEYFSSLWNWNDLTYLVLNIMLLSTHLFCPNFPLQKQRYIAAASACFIWFKLLDWLRLFDDTAFYISLMWNTVWDIKYFMIIMTIWYMLFGTAFYLLNLSRNNDTSFVPNIFGFWVFDAFESMYELGLGEFQLDGYQAIDTQIAMLYTLFFLATFFIQIVFLNMLIAIMGDTFGRETENQDLNARITKLDIMTDYVDLIKDVKEDEKEILNPWRKMKSFFKNKRETRQALKEEKEKAKQQKGTTSKVDEAAKKEKSQKQKEQADKGPKNFLYTVQIDSQDNLADTDTWEGQVNAIKKHVDQAVNKGFKGISVKLDKITNRVAENEIREQAGEREVKGQVTRFKDNMQNSMSTLRNNVDEIKQDMQKNQDEIMKLLKQQFNINDSESQSNISNALTVEKLEEDDGEVVTQDPLRRDSTRKSATPKGIMGLLRQTQEMMRSETEPQLSVVQEKPIETSEAIT